MTNDFYSGCHSLPPDTCLHDTYQIRETIGTGGFGITYLGIHKGTHRSVAIKEYFPFRLAVRNKMEDVFVLQPFPDKNTELFLKGRQRFLHEAKILKSLPDLDSIVSVYDLFEENGTVYLVMEYIDGLTLSRYIHENSPLTFPEISELMAPVVRSLSEIHKKGLIHRDISPDNLILGIDNRLHLIDFGAASHDISEHTKNTVILKPGYAPPEQYLPNGKTGAWTDIYAICATMYFSLTGEIPAEAMTRLDGGVPLNTKMQTLLPWQSAILEKGLQLRPSDRFQTADELYLALTETPVKAIDAVTQIKTDLSAKEQTRIRRLSRHHRYRPELLTSICAVLLFAFAVLFYFYFFRQHNAAQYQPPAVTASHPAASATPTEQPSQTELPSETPAQISEPLIIPDVTGLTLKQAKKKLNALDPSIRIDTSYMYSKSKKAGIITRQSIAKGFMFSNGHLSSISLTVSKGKKPSATQPPVSKPEASKSSDYQVKDDDDLTSIPLE